VKNSKSPSIRVLIHDHIQVLKAYRLFCNHSKKGVVQGYLLVLRRCVQENCLLGIEKSCTDLVKVVCQVVYKVLVLSVQNKVKENLKRVAWGLDVGQEDRIRIKSLLFVFAYFLRLISFIASYFI